MDKTITVSHLTNAGPLTDLDHLPVSQPGVYNPITQQNGDTRKVSLKTLKDFILESINSPEAAFPPGVITYIAINDEWLPTFRLLKLEGQTINIAPDSPYHQLGQVCYVGDSKNNNTDIDGFYKVNANGERTTGGTRMVLPDMRGMFMRGAGVNSRHFPSIDTLYDGGDIGSYISDAIRNITGSFHSGTLMASIHSLGGAFFTPISDRTGRASPNWANEDAWPILVSFAASQVVPTANENRPASVSANICISY